MNKSVLSSEDYIKAINTYYLQFMGQVEQVKYNSIDEVKEVIAQKLDEQGKHFAGFILSMREDQEGGANMFGVKHPTWYALNDTEARFWLKKIYPTIKHKVATRTFSLAKTNEQIEEEFTGREIKSIAAHELKYGSFAYAG